MCGGRGGGGGVVDDQMKDTGTKISFAHISTKWGRVPRTHKNQSHQSAQISRRMVYAITARFCHFVTIRHELIPK